MEHKVKEFPEGMVPLGSSSFHFQCHPGLTCFTRCCRNVDLTLYPYDIIRLKQALGIGSEQFLRMHTFLQSGDNRYFPTVKLKLNEDDAKGCPFLSENGCSVYHDRPSACRTYPLERAVDRSPRDGRPAEYYFLTNHPYCLGHREDTGLTVHTWIRNQRLTDFNIMNDLWAEIDTVFRQNPWSGEEVAGERQQLAFMICYNIDGFRRFAEEQQLLKQFYLEKDVKKRIAKEDGELLKFGFEWLKLVLTGRGSLSKK